MLRYCDRTLGLIGMWSNVCFGGLFFLFHFFVHLFNFPQILVADVLSGRCVPLFCMSGNVLLGFLFFFFSFQNDIKNCDLFSVLCVSSYTSFGTHETVCTALTLLFDVDLGGHRGGTGPPRYTPAG